MLLMAPNAIVEERGGYIVVRLPYAARRMHSLLRIPRVVFAAARGARLRPRTAAKLYSLAAIHPEYYSLDALAELLGTTRNELRMNLVGRPEAARVLVEAARPHYVFYHRDPAREGICRGQVVPLPVYSDSTIYMCRVEY